MAYRSLQFTPGLNSQLTPTANRTGWVAELNSGVPTSNLIRFPAFNNGQPEVIGGWARFFGVPASLVGVCRGLHSWAVLDGTLTLAAGTSDFLYICQGGDPYEITPIKQTSTLSSPFTTVNASETVEVTDTVDPAVGDWINVEGPIVVNGLTLDGTYQVTQTGTASYKFLAEANLWGFINNGTNSAGNTLTLTQIQSGNTQVGSILSGTSITAGTSLTAGSALSWTTSGSAELISPEIMLATAKATSAGSGGGAGVKIDYLLPAGLVDQSVGQGWGIGGYGYGGWGSPHSGSGSLIFPAIWELDNWGQNLIACRRGGTIYQWQPGYGLAGRAQAITYAPPAANGVLVAMPQQQLIVWGSSIPNPSLLTWGSQDPMEIVWTDFSDYSLQQNWFASATNAAGSFRLTQGSTIMQCLRSQGQILVWTDTALVAMQFIGSPFYYGFQQLGTGCGLISPKAAGVVGGSAFWWSEQNFYVYNGVVEPIPCPVRDIVFNHLNAAQYAKICCSVNTEFSEVQWEFPSIYSPDNDSYVSFNYVNHTWGFGTLADPEGVLENGEVSGTDVGRTARIGADVFQFPIAADDDGNVWFHEVGYTAGGEPMAWSLQSGYADISEGEIFSFVDEIVPDSVQSGGDIGISVYGQNYPNDTPEVQGPYSCGDDSTYVTPRLRARQMAIRFANDYSVSGLFWRLGRVRVRTAANGRR